MTKTKTIPYSEFSQKQIEYMAGCIKHENNCAEGSIRSGKTIMHCLVFSMLLEVCQDKIHLASGSTVGNAKMNIGVCNGFGLEFLFRGRCHWGKYRDNEALFVKTKTGDKIVLFVGGGKADSYKKILGFSIGMWIATEINLHYDDGDSETSFIKVAMGRQAAAISVRRFWDLNPSSPNHKIYKTFIDKWRNSGLLHYEHFTMDDNLSISEERKESIKAQYDVNSVWYKRDILGMRCIAEGLIYQAFADNPKKREISKQDFEKVRPYIIQVECGIDFGGNGSAHTFVAVAFTRFYRDVICLKSERLSGEYDPKQLNNMFVKFAQEIYNKYAKGFDTNYDNAEPVLARGIRNAVAENGCMTELKPAFKNPILQRIRLETTLLSQDRFYYLQGECDSMVNAFCGAVWDSKHPDTRLDNGTSDIDTMDAYEYAIEKHTNDLLAQKTSLVRGIINGLYNNN